MTTKGSEGPKVTECWSEPLRDGRPTDAQPWKTNDEQHPAILMWREDYDALRKSLKHRTELYWKLTAEFDAMRKELEELRQSSEYIQNSYLELLTACGKENTTLHKELEELRAESYWRNYRGT